MSAATMPRSLCDYRIQFLNADGSPIADVPVEAASLKLAVERAVGIASELNAADFTVMVIPPKVSEINRR
jgi:hypothetical protein